jgi:hypothetical protein
MSTNFDMSHFKVSQKCILNVLIIFISIKL